MSDMAGLEPSPIPIQGDGPADRVWRRQPRKPPVAAIFIHAGAGYHSIANEGTHLKACSDAARIGMIFLKAGGTAVEAVEAAVRHLEDQEITNAGFGSNLNRDGVVECDATIVDHLGRSGACGAVPGVKNPISLARRILDASRQPLSLRRVAPNILVGQGAKVFAEEQGITTTRNEFLISRNALDRWLHWNEDLKIAGTGRYRGGQGTPTPGDYEKAADPASHVQRPDHTSAILTGTWNEGQPDSPYSGGSPFRGSGSPPTAAGPAIPPRRGHDETSRATLDPGGAHSRSPRNLVSASFREQASPRVVMQSMECDTLADGPSPISARPIHDGSASANDSGEDTADDVDYYETYSFDAVYDKGNVEAFEAPAEHTTTAKDMDVVTDTVGAIAIDMKGNIAAGSSSGGIGMKHRGRVGPAALVGVGTAVVPQDPDDDLATSVAAVTSGTGEHMATSRASARCADRLYQGTRRGPGGRDVPEEDEHVLMESFILHDFMGHPGVGNQLPAGAIGVMAVKKDRTGAYLYFAHNTESFALASMSSTEREPLCVMSRLGKTRQVAQGARKVRLA